MYKHTTLNNIWLKATKTEILKDIKYDLIRHLKFAEDVWYTVALLELSNKIIYTYNQYYNYRIRPNSMAITSYKEKVLDMTIAREFLYNISNNECKLSMNDNSDFFSNYLERTIKCVLPQICVSKGRKEYVELIKNIQETNFYSQAINNYKMREMKLKFRIPVYLLIHKQFSLLTILSLFRCKFNYFFKMR
jgi:hypothetical protein